MNGSNWVNWEQKKRDGFHGPLPYWECQSENDSIFKVFLMAITDVLGDDAQLFTEDLQNFLGDISYAIGQTTHVFDCESIDDYEFPQNVPVPIKIPRYKGNNEIHFLFVFNRFQQTCGNCDSKLYGLGFICLREPFLQYYTPNNSERPIVPAKFIRSIHEWKKWIHYIIRIRAFANEVSPDPPLTIEWLSEMGLEFHSPPFNFDHGRTTMEEKYKAFEGGHMFFSPIENELINGNITREEILERLRKRMTFYTIKSASQIQDFHMKQIITGLRSKCVQDRAIDYLLKFILAILFFKNKEYFMQIEQQLFNLRMEIQLSTPALRFDVLKSNGLLNSYSTHILTCNHTLKECLPTFLWETYARFMFYTFLTIEHMYFKEKENADGNEKHDGDATERHRESPKSIKIGELEIDDIIIDAAKVVKESVLMAGDGYL